jgi:hypothetical protein
VVRIPAERLGRFPKGPARLGSYGWGAEQMNALNALLDMETKRPASQVDRDLRYIKERYGSPAKALEFRKANTWY